MTNPPKDRSGFQIAIFCALPLEAENVQAVFDRCWEDEGVQYHKTVGDQNAYTTGMIGKHNVVLVHLSGMGGNGAALAAAGLRCSFPAIQLALVVGICGVVPIHPTTNEEIILGDVIISTTVIHYDLGRQYPNAFQPKREVEDSLGRAIPEVRSFVNMLKTKQRRQHFAQKLEQLTFSQEFQHRVTAATYPGEPHDKLYDSSYPHRHRSQETCDHCQVEGICSRSCVELGCEDDKLLLRNRLTLKGAETERGTGHMPRVHIGRFGSTNVVMKSGQHRDAIAKSDEVTAFEMEGAGVWDQFPTIVIKAACDYSDSHKNKQWQDYSAAMAAGGMKVLLQDWTHTQAFTGSESQPDPIWHVPFDSMPGFIGRQNELRTLEQKLSSSDGHRVFSLLGLGGVGKTRLASELAHRFKSRHPKSSVIWLQASGQLTFEKDIFEVGIKLKIPGIKAKEADTKALVKQNLSLPSAGRWLLILDNADDEVMWASRSNAHQQDRSLVSFLPRTTYGSILVTTRSRQVANFLAEKDVVLLDKMTQDEATDLFKSKLEDTSHVTESETLQKLLPRLANLPLAVVQAAAYINMTGISISTYLSFSDHPETEVPKTPQQRFQ